MFGWRGPTRRRVTGDRFETPTDPLAFLDIGFYTNTVKLSVSGVTRVGVTRGGN